VANDRDEQLRSTTVLCVFFGEYVETDVLLALVAEQRSRHRLRGEALQTLLAHLEHDTSLPTVVAQRGRDYHDLMEAWLGEVEERLAARRR
jgi:hypothetical protein